MHSEARVFDRLAVGTLLVLSALTIMLYWPALPGPLLLDDRSVIAPLLRMAQLGQDWRSFLFSDSGPLGRPLAMASFILNAHWSLDLRYWKATNLALHVLNGWLVYALCIALARAARIAQAATRRFALGATALWLLHPVHISTVMYLCQRMTELATLFGLLALLLYAYGRMAGVEARGARLAIGVSLLICTPLAAFSKEIGLLTPFYVLALEACLFDTTRWPRPRSLSALLAACTLVPLVLGAVYFATHWHATFVGPYTLREFGPLERVLTEARVMLGYLGWIIMPRRAALGFYHDDVAIAHWPPDVATAFASAALCALAVSAWRARQRAPLLAFGVLLFLVGHALESSVFALELVFEHRNYLPAIGICIALAALATQALSARLAMLVLASLALLYGLVTASMTPSWGNEGALYASFLRDHPGSRRARASLVEWQLGRGDLASAARVLADASDVSAQLHRVRLACLRDHAAGSAAAALHAAAHAARPDDMSVEILLWLATQVQDRACALDSRALVDTLEAIRDRPLPHNSRFRLYVSAAQLRHARGEHMLAAEAVRVAAQLVPRDPYPLYLAVEIALDAGERDSARTLLTAARARARQQHEDFSRIDSGLEAALQAP